MASDEEISDHLDSDLSDLESDTCTSESSCKKIYETLGSLQFTGTNRNGHFKGRGSCD